MPAPFFLCIRLCCVYKPSSTEIAEMVCGTLLIKSNQSIMIYLENVGTTQDFRQARVRLMINESVILCNLSDWAKPRMSGKIFNLWVLAPGVRTTTLIRTPRNVLLLFPLSTETKELDSQSANVSFRKQFKSNVATVLKTGCPILPTRS